MEHSHTDGVLRSTRKGRTSLALAIIGVALLGAAACDEKLSDIAGPTPNLEPTFSSINQIILQASDSSGRRPCIQCHTDQGRTPAARLLLTSGAAYNSLVNVGSVNRPGETLVKPGDPDNSYLIKKLEGAAGIAGVRMPLGSPAYLTEGQMLIVRRWIANGARND